MLILIGKNKHIREFRNKSNEYKNEIKKNKGF